MFSRIGAEHAYVTSLLETQRTVPKYMHVSDRIKQSKVDAILLKTFRVLIKGNFGLCCTRSSMEFGGQRPFIKEHVS